MTTGFRDSRASGRGAAPFLRTSPLLTDLVVGLLAGGALFVAIREGGRFGFGLERLLGAAAGVAVFAVLVRRPLLALHATFFVVPVSVALLSLTYSSGVPAGVVRFGALGKDAVAVALFVAGARVDHRRNRRFTTVDRAGIAYLALVGLWYLLTPLVAVGSLAGDARLVAARELTIFVLVFLGVRWLSPDAVERSKLLVSMVSAASVLALIGVYQRFNRAAFVEFLLVDLDVDRYYREVAGLSGGPLREQLAWLFAEPFRVVSLLMAPFGYADITVTGFAGATALLAGRGHRRLALAAVVLLAYGTVISGTRINMVALAAVLFVMLLDRRGMSERTRVQVFALSLIVIVAFVPTVLGSRLLGDDNTVSNEGHRNELTTAIEQISDRPIGYGLGSDGSVQRRFENVDTVSGNAILGIGIQAGVVTMGAFLVFLAAVFRELERRRRLPVVDVATRVGFLALVGGVVAVSTHNGWTDLTSGGFVWATIALGLGAVDDGRTPVEERVDA